MSRKVQIVKRGQAPASKPLGVNPQDPWSAKANITEASEEELLSRFLKAKGINPNFVSKDTKIAHSKSGEFMKWRRDHDFIEQTVVSPTLQRHKALERRSRALGNVGTAQQKYSMHEEEYLDEGIFTDDESIAKHLVKKYGKNVRSHDIKLAMHFHPEPHKTSLERIAGHVKRLTSGTKPVTEAKKLTSLDKFRRAAAEREKKHAEIEKQQSKDGSGMTSAIDRLEKHLNKEAADAGISKTKETQFHKKLDTLVHSTFGKRKDEMKMKEEAQHKVGDSVTVSSKFFGKQKGKVTKIDNQSIHVQRTGKKTSEKYPHNAVVKEDVYQDSQAATQTAFDMGTTPNQTEPTYSRKREMSKSARMIKALYKNKKMVKEDMYDHEKEDKSVQTYGKKPKMNSTKKEESFGDNKPDAAAIMTGGTTLTGEKRDDVEIDPMMRNKPGQNTFDKGFGKKGS